MKRQTITTGSISRLHTYEQCPLRAKLQFVDKIAEPPQETESPLERGSRLHESIEKYIRGASPELDPEINHFLDEIEAYKVLLEEEPAKLMMEEMWMYDDTWTPTDSFDDSWFRMKLDVVEHIDETEIEVVDWKTGKRYGNEVKHGDQMLTYALGTFLKYPECERVHAHLFYLDAHEGNYKLFSRTNTMRMLAQLNTRMLRMTEDTIFEPKPSRQHCMWCTYKTGSIGRGKNKREGLGVCHYNPE